MDREKTVLKDIDNSLLAKRSKKTEALQELVHIRPDLKGKSVYFFPTLDRYFEGILMFDAKEKKAYVYSVKNDHKYETFFKWMTGLKNQKLFKGKKSSLSTIFLEPNPTSLSIASILRKSDYPSYWKSSTLMNLEDIFMLIQEEILLGGKFSEITVQKINEGLELNFFKKEEQSVEKKILFIAKGILLEYKVYILNQVLQETHLPFPVKARKRTFNEVKDLIEYVISLNICYGQSTIGFEDVTHIRGTQLVNNVQNSSKEHTPFAFLEKQGQQDEVYRHTDCMLIVKKKKIICGNCEKLRRTMQQICRRFLTCTNSKKIVHASKDLLVEKVKEQRKVIYTQNEKISNIKKYLEQRVEKEEVEVSDEMANVIHDVAKNFTSKNIDISDFHPIFQELIRIQTGKSNGTRYHPMFLRWAISVYSKSGHAAYNAMKTIMRLPSISTLKSYINENEQCSGWQNKIANQMLANLTTNNIWGFGRIGFFSHDSFKIQKGLLWNQRKNCYVGYLDFENEIQEYKDFAIQCQNEIEQSIEKNSLSFDKQKHELATQVHQFVWHSITHNFSFPISYYGINNITAHNLNTLIFDLAAKLECIGVYTIGSICDGAGENRMHIKSFDWYASKWSSDDIVEVNFNKNKNYFHAAEIIDNNFEKTKFTVQRLNCNNSEKITIERSFIRPPMPPKLEWNVNDLCELKSPKDNQWHLGQIIHFDPITSIFTVEISGTKEGWQVFDYHVSEFLRPVYDNQKLLANHKTINPITGEDWFFISDPTHVFKKLRNNLSKSHTGEKNAREIMFNRKEISWRHIKGVYDHTCQHAVAKATKLTKRHIWLTSWSKMRVDLVEDTLSKEVEDALVSIKELKDISEGTKDFIRYSRKYRQIMHSKINFKSLEDTRINTLKEIRDWFIHGDKQKTESKEWISSQCQFDLILSINGFLGMLEFILKKYPTSMVQPRRISQDMLEGLFGTIREIGGDSSTHTLKSYGHALNKHRVTALVSSEVKSINYGKANSAGTGITNLIRRDYRKEKPVNNEKNNCIHQKYNFRLEQLSPIAHDIFESLFVDDLIMGRIDIPLESHNENVKQENLRIFHLQNERCNLIEAIFYKDSIDELLQKWQNIIRNMAHNAIPKKIGAQWLANWNSHLEISLNNFRCSGSWYQDFLVVAGLNGSSTQRLVAYLLLQKVIKFTFSKKIAKTHLTANQDLIPEKIIVLEPAEASKFSYIVGWIVYKLIKSDNVTKSHPEFETIYAYFMSLNSEQVVYEQDVRSQTTNIIPGQEFLGFMYKMESLILLLFEKHKELGPNILQYIHNSLLCNIPLLKSFNILLNTSTCNQKLELKDDAKNFLYERIITIYMRSRQKSWRRFNDLIPEKGTSSLRENLKSMRSDNQIKNKHTLKKSNIPKDPILGLMQLQVWARLDCAEEEFTNMFLVSELQWLLWAFGNNVKTDKKKKNLIPLVLDHLKKETPFSKEAILKGQIFI